MARKIGNTSVDQCPDISRYEFKTMVDLLGNCIDKEERWWKRIGIKTFTLS